MKATTHRRDARIVDAWNEGVNTLAELGRAFHLPRNSIGRILTECRRAGMVVLTIDAAERGARMRRGHRDAGAGTSTAVSVPTPPSQKPMGSDIGDGP